MAEQTVSGKADLGPVSRPGAAVWAASVVMALVALLPEFMGFWPWDASHLSLVPEASRALAALAAFAAGVSYALAGPGGGLVAGYFAVVLLPLSFPAWIEDQPVAMVASDLARGAVFSIAFGAALGGLAFGADKRRVPHCLVWIAALSGGVGAFAVAAATAGVLRFSFFLLGMALACACAGWVALVQVSRRGRLVAARQRALDAALEERGADNPDQMVRAGLKKTVFTHGGVEFACRPLALAAVCLGLGGFSAVAGLGAFFAAPLLFRLSRLPLRLLVWPALCCALAASLGGVLGLFVGKGNTELGGWLLLALCGAMGAVAGKWSAAGLLEPIKVRAALALPALALALVLGSQALTWIFS